MCFGSFQFNWGLLEKSETLSLENRNTYEMGSSSEWDGNSALFRNLWSWVYSWGFLTQFQNSILLFHNNRKHLQEKKKQIFSPHITFYEFTLISAYRSYILFSFFIWINIKIDKQKGGKNVNGIVFWFWTRLVRYCVPLPAVESNWQIILDYYPVH